MFEFEKHHLKVDPDWEIDCDIGCVVTAYLETWFDVDEKFNIQTHNDDDVYVNFYAKYNVESDELTTEYCISRLDSCEYHDYSPTEKEEKLIKKMMEDCCNRHYDCNLRQFIQQDDEFEMMML